MSCLRHACVTHASPNAQVHNAGGGTGTPESAGKVQTPFISGARASRAPRFGDRSPLKPRRTSTRRTVERHENACLYGPAGADSNAVSRAKVSPRIWPGPFQNALHREETLMQKCVFYASTRVCMHAPVTLGDVTHQAPSRSWWASCAQAGRDAPDWAHTHASMHTGMRRCRHACMHTAICRASPAKTRRCKHIELVILHRRAVKI